MEDQSSHIDRQNGYVCKKNRLFIYCSESRFVSRTSTSFTGAVVYDVFHIKSYRGFNSLKDARKAQTAVSALFYITVARMHSVNSGANLEIFIIISTSTVSTRWNTIHIYECNIVRVLKDAIFLAFVEN